MRWLFMLMLVFVSLAARADGFAYGKGFQMLQQTDQVAVIDMDEERADVSMFIAIGGIAEGETITYVLPFWYRPDGFELKEMAPADYREKYVKPAHEKVMRMNRIADNRGSSRVLTSTAMFGVGFLGPILMPTFGARSKGRAGSQLSPYAVHRTAHASAELYKVEAKDLQQLVEQAGLPAEYAEPLKKYKTSFFAVMRLTGPKREKETEMLSPLEGSGVCYRFRHALPPEKRGEYIYPLGTGAAWPKSILLTEVFVTCPDRFSLQVTAPESGTATEYRSFNSKIRNIYYHLQMTPEERKKYQSRNPYAKESDLFMPMSAHLLSEDARAPSAWHIAYLNSNPDEDIRVRLAPREAPWRLAVADAFARSGPFDLAALSFALLGWLVAGLAVVRPRWRKAGKPGSLLRHILVAIVVVNLWITIGLVILGFIIAGLSWLVTYTANPVIPGILIAMAVAVMLAVLVFYTRRWVMGPSEDWRQNVGLFSWLLATAIYLALNTGLYYFVRWCETAV
jgi:hypothetical protein